MGYMGTLIYCTQSHILPNSGGLYPYLRVEGGSRLGINYRLRVPWIGSRYLYLSAACSLYTIIIAEPQSLQMSQILVIYCICECLKLTNVTFFFGGGGVCGFGWTLWARDRQTTTMRAARNRRPQTLSIRPKSPKSRTPKP